MMNFDNMSRLESKMFTAYCRANNLSEFDHVSLRRFELEVIERLTVIGPDGIEIGPEPESTSDFSAVIQLILIIVLFVGGIVIGCQYATNRDKDKKRAAGHRSEIEVNRIVPTDEYHQLLKNLKNERSNTKD